MKAVVFGAHGRTGTAVVDQALQAGHQVVAVTRRAAPYPISHPMLTVEQVDVRDAFRLPAVVSGADAVLCTLGVPLSMKPIDTYSVGVRNIAAAMDQAGTRRLVVVSSTGAHPMPGRKNAPAALRLFEPLLKFTVGKSTYADQRRMERVLRASELAWTVVLPSGLFDLDTVTKYIAGEVDPVGALTSRTDLAHYLLHVAEDDRTTGKVVTVSTVDNVPSLWKMIRREAFGS